MSLRDLTKPFLSVVAISLIIVSQARADVPVLNCEAIETKPHDNQSFTQGFEINDGWLYESSGQYGSSFLTMYREDDDGNQSRIDLPRDVFAEGLTLVGDELYLISWKAGKAWSLDTNTFAVKKQFSYEGEGWGIAYDGQKLVMSDGSSLLRFYRPESFELTGTLTVKLNGKKLDKLNELEIVDGLLWANRWYSNSIYAIDLTSGKVVAEMNCDGLRKLSGADNSEQVLNGIAYDKNTDSFWLTGKYWPSRFRVKRPSLSLDPSPLE